MAWVIDGNSYNTRKKLTINSALIDTADLTDFPCLVKLSAENFDFSHANADGFDIRFTAADGSTLLKYERERHSLMEDFTTYTETDASSHIAVTSSSRITWTTLFRNEDAYVYKDAGVDHFSGDFEHLVTFLSSTGSYTHTVIWSISNAINDFSGIDVAGDSELGVTVYTGDGGCGIYLWEVDSGAAYLDSYAGTINTPYYLKIKRDEAVGTYGTLYCYVYKDAARTNLVDTLTLSLHTSKKDFRYVYAVQSFNDGQNYSNTGYVENLNLQEGGGNAEYWVKIPTVDYDADTDFFMYYSTSDIADGADPTNVWDANYKGVYHMNSADNATLVDSTGHNNSASNTLDTTSSGKIGLAMNDDGSEYASFSAADLKDLAAPFTFEAWLSSSTTGSYKGIMGNFSDNDAVVPKGATIFTTTTNKIRVMIQSNGYTSFDGTSTNICDGAWRHICVTFAGTTANLYVNGTTENSPQTLSYAAGTEAFVIGRVYVDVNGQYLTGNLDEVRVSNSARLAQWIKASYNSGNDTLLTYGGEEVPVTNYTEAVTETLGLSEVKTKKTGFKKIKTDSVATIDTITKKSIFNKIKTDILSFTDLTVLKSGFNKIKTDTISSVDSIVKSLGFKKLISDNLSLTDLISLKSSWNKIVSEVIGLVDDITVVYTQTIHAFTETITETLNLADQTIKKSVWYKTLMSEITLSDIISASRKFLLDISDAIYLTDIINKSSRFVVSSIESISLSEPLIILRSIWQKTVSSVISLVDTTEISKRLSVIITDTISLISNITKISTWKKTLTDIITTIESTTNKLKFRKTFTDVITTTDSILKRISISIRDTLILVGTTTKKSIWKKTFTNTIILIEKNVVSHGVKKIFTDTIALVDTFRKRIGITETERLILTDTIAKKSIWRKTFSDNIVIKEIWGVVSGAWEWAIKHPANWTSPTKHTSTWTNPTKHQSTWTFTKKYQ